MLSNSSARITPATFAFSVLGLYLCLFVTYYLYSSGFAGPFLLDDFWNLEPLNSRGGVVNLESFLAFVFSNTSGTLGRPVSMLSFLIDDQYWPGNETTFKRTNLLIHLLVSCLIFLVVYYLVSLAKTKVVSPIIAALSITVVWLVHPLNTSTVLYVIQRMTQLSALFVFLGLIFYIAGRTRIIEGKRFGFCLVLCSLGPVLSLAIFSKENGFLLIPLCLLIELSFFRWGGLAKYQSRLLGSYLILAVVALILYFLLKLDSYAGRYASRDFDLSERLYTQLRVLWMYVKVILTGSTAGMGLVHDDITISTNLTSPFSTLVALLAWLFALIVSFLLRRRVPLLGFGVAFYLIGHSIEAGVVPIELYFEHRNYLSMVGIFISVLGLMDAGLSYVTASVSRFVGGGIFLVVIGLSLLTSQQVYFWSSPYNLLTIWATEHPDSKRAQRIYGQYLLRHEDWVVEGLRLVEKGRIKHPKDPTFDFILLNANCRFGENVSVSYESLMNKLDESKYNGGLVTMVKLFGDLRVGKECDVDAEELSLVHQVIEKATSIKGIRAKAKASLLYYHGNLYVKLGLLNEAMSKFDQAKTLQKNFTVPLRQAQVLTSAGLYAEALEFIGEAYLYDENRIRPWIVPDNKKEIRALELKILSLKGEV